MNIVFGVIVGLLVLTLLVIAHEFGHFIFARKSGVKVNEFGIGFPPRAIAWQKDKTGKWRRLPKNHWPKPEETPKSMIFSLNWLPIGGFCQMDGESAADTKQGTFGATTFWQKTKILFGGVLMNWLVAILIFTILAPTSGIPYFLDHQFYLSNDAYIANNHIPIVKVLPNTPAEQAGFEAGDLITRINGTPVFLPENIKSTNQPLAGQTVDYEILRNGETMILSPTLSSADNELRLGIEMDYPTEIPTIRSTWSAPIVGLATTAQLTGETFKGLGQLLFNLGSGIVKQFNPDARVREAGRSDIGTVGESVSGPVGIIGVIFPAFTSGGLAQIAFLAAVISLSLACMNVLLIPALDGGRWLLIAIYKLRKKPLAKATEEKIVGRALFVLLALFLIVTILDITKFF